MINTESPPTCTIKSAQLRSVGCDDDTSCDDRVEGAVGGGGNQAGIDKTVLLRPPASPALHCTDPNFSALCSCAAVHCAAVQLCSCALCSCSLCSSAAVQLCTVHCAAVHCALCTVQLCRR